MKKYFDLFLDAYVNYAGYLWSEITNPSFKNYFYLLIAVSIFFFVLEVIVPWRKKQPIIRKDFWMDAFYMFFNFFLFSLIIYNAASEVVVNLFNDGIKNIFGGFDLQAVNPLKDWPFWSILLIGFVVTDLIQWLVHRLLHRSSWLWNFHQVHHSVEEMGFAAHLRYHWMENVVYATIQYIPLALLGIGLYDFFIIHIFTLSWGHYNHSNISINKFITAGILSALIGLAVAYNLIDFKLFEQASAMVQHASFVGILLIGTLVLGPIMPYLFNSPEMHIWHHAYDLPEDKRFGVNFGLTLAIWDYVFKTAHIPEVGRDIKLGFPGVEEFPNEFMDQVVVGYKKSK